MSQRKQCFYHTVRRIPFKISVIFYLNIITELINFLHDSTTRRAGSILIL